MLPNCSRRRFLALIPASLAVASRLSAKEPPKMDQLDTISRGNTAFGFDLARLLAKAPGNQFISPFSISTALALAMTGAKGETLRAMQKTLKLTQEADTIDRGFASLLPAINGVGIDEKKRGYQLSTSNNLWAQNGVAWQAEFLKRAQSSYSAGLHHLDFINATEASRLAINAEVEKDTREKIKDLLPQGSVTTMTRLVLTNAVYFKGDWEVPFDVKQTRDADFTTDDGKKSSVPLMTYKQEVSYMATESYQAIRLMYAGRQTAMTIVLPTTTASLSKVEQSLDGEAYTKLATSFRGTREATVFLPRFKIEAEYSLVKPLATLGMGVAFEDKADFSGMTSSTSLSISDVIHKSFVEVNEKGTEAAAATGIVMRATSAQIVEPVIFRADRPFLFFLEHLPTKTLLFSGRYAKPTN